MRRFMIGAALAALFVGSAPVSAIASGVVWVCDPDNPGNCFAPDANGKVQLTASGSTGSPSPSTALLSGMTDGVNLRGLNAIGGAAASSNSANNTLAVEETGGTYSNITTATTTTVKSGKGYVHFISFNTCVASATVTVFDNTSASGNKIGTFTCPATVGNPFTVFGNGGVFFSTGLTIVTSGATDLTVSFR